MFRLVFLLALIFNASGSSGNHVIDYVLLAKLENGLKANAVIEFVQKTQPILDRINSFKFESRGAKITSMKWELEELATSSQKDVVNFLKSRDAKFDSYWINNRVIAQQLSLEDVQKISALPEVALVREEIVASVIKPIEVTDNGVNAEWNIVKLEVQEAWNMTGGNNGTGVIVATIDTGVRYTHEALRDNFLGDYGWYDPYYRMPRPVDEDGEGTMTMGVVAGSHSVGIAPGARWASCRGCFWTNCTEAALTTCGQWITCPTLSNGQSPDCSKAPKVVSNSWRDEVRGNPWYRSVVEVWHAAGIVPVFSLGNLHDTCASVSSPAFLDNVIAVGASNETDGISSSSERGPTADGRIKPDLVAPGDHIRCPFYISEESYVYLSGGSVAGPHVAGTVALLLARDPNLTYEQVKDFLQDNAERQLGNATTCGTTPPDVFPNNIYGYGRIATKRSLAAAIGSF